MWLTALKACVEQLNDQFLERLSFLNNHLAILVLLIVVLLSSSISYSDMLFIKQESIQLS